MIELLEALTVHILVSIANVFTAIARAILRFTCWMNDVSFDEWEKEAEKRGPRIG